MILGKGKTWISKIHEFIAGDMKHKYIYTINMLCVVRCALMLLNKGVCYHSDKTLFPGALKQLDLSVN